jgi:DNA-binding NtrC family response regulator
VPALTQHFLERFRRELKRDLRGITPEALAFLRRYAWPGNVRELENVIERAAVLTDGPDVTLRDLPADIREAGLTEGIAREAARTYHAAVEEFKRGLIASTLRRTAGNRTRAARLLGLQRTYLARLIRDLGLAGARPVPALAGEVAPMPARAASE